MTFILEDTFEMPYAEMVQLKIIEPLGLRDTYVGGATHVAKNEAYSYSFTEEW